MPSLRAFFVSVLCGWGCSEQVSPEAPLVSPPVVMAPPASSYVLSLPATVPAVVPVALPEPVAFQKGVNLGIYNESKGKLYEQRIDEIAALGADHLGLIIHLWQSGPAATQLYTSSNTISDKRLKSVVAYAHQKGLKVFLYPIINVTSPGGWRGSLAATDWEAWWSSYRALVLRYAGLAEETKAEVFSVGSEMSSIEEMSERWISLIEEVRKKFSGKILYAANWDRYQHVPFVKHLDYLGVDAYFPLTDRSDPSYEELVLAWQRNKKEILSWYRKTKTPLLFTELGYPSQDGANQRPWDYASGAPVDLEEQLLCFQAFREVWSQEPALHGVYIWIWAGGKSNKTYSPKGKPAEEELRNWFRSDAREVAP